MLEEVRRWNDQDVDSLADYGVKVDPTEERLQVQTLELMAAEELALEEE